MGTAGQREDWDGESGMQRNDNRGKPHEGKKYTELAKAYRRMVKIKADTDKRIERVQYINWKEMDNNFRTDEILMQKLDTNDYIKQTNDRLRQNTTRSSRTTEARDKTPETMTKTQTEAKKEIRYGITDNNSSEIVIIAEVITI